jgi:hypothetical protein
MMSVTPRHILISVSLAIAMPGYAVAKAPPCSWKEVAIKDERGGGRKICLAKSERAKAKKICSANGSSNWVSCICQDGSSVAACGN